MIKEYKELEKVIEITLDNGKVVKCDKKWAYKSMESLGTDLEDVLLMYLEDNDYLINDSQEELDKNAKGSVKNIVKSEKAERKQTTRERKPNVAKENIISDLSHFLLQNDDYSLINVENKAKIITFTYQNKEFKLDLVEKRVKKEEKVK